MRKITSFLIVMLLIACCFGVTGFSDQSDEYSNVAAVFHIGTGARPLGMGGAFAGLADDENAVFYNPAGLSFLDEMGVTSLISPQFGQLMYGSLGFAAPNYGLNMVLLDSGSINSPNAYGAPTGQTFNYMSGGGLGAFAISLTPNLSLGTRFKYYHSQVTTDPPSSASGWAVEPSVLVKYQGLRLGILFENAFGQDIVYSSGHREEWSPSIRLGGSLRLPLGKAISLTFVGDMSGLPVPVISDKEFNFTPHLGLELWAAEIGVRVGINDKANTVGASVRSDNWRIDWAYAAYRSSLSDTQRLSLTVRF